MPLPALPAFRGLQDWPGWWGTGGNARGATSSSRLYERRQLSELCRFLLYPVFLGMALKEELQGFHRAQEGSSLF